MEKTFTYLFEKERFGDECNVDEFDYSPSEDVLKLAIVDELFLTYFRKEERKLFNSTQTLAIKNALKNLTDDNDNWEELGNDYYYDLTERFEEDARKKYKERG